MIEPRTLKGFRDFLPGETIKRNFVITKLREIFELFGFDPLETPALEYGETLLGKYGNEADKLLYLFEDKGGRRVGLRYDQTVPLSRVIAQYPELPRPFKRYQIQPVWRAENTQKGRYREFLQCDIDYVGNPSEIADAEIIATTLTALKRLGLPHAIMVINDRMVFDTLKLSKAEIIILDKLDKIGKAEVIAQLRASGRSDAESVLSALEASPMTKRLDTIANYLKDQGFNRDEDFRFDPFLARGLEYYTSTIFEVKIEEYPAGSLAGGGRFDKLIGSFTGNDVPAVGIAFGFDRIIEAMEIYKLLPKETTTTQVMVTVFEPRFLEEALYLTSSLREHGIRTEVAPLIDAKLDKQLKYADRKGIPYIVIEGPDESARGVVKLKNLKMQSQEELTVEQLIEKLTSN